MMRIVFLLTAVLAFVATAAIPEACKNMSQYSIFYDDISNVKACFESYQISQDFIDGIVENLEVIGDIYPYVDIDQNPPETVQRRNPVNYDDGLEELKKTLDNSDRIISNVFRATNKFIASFHDGHFGMYTTADMEDDLFYGFGCALPFLWEYLPDKDGKFHVYILAREREIFLDQDAHNKIVQKQNDNVTIEKVDDVDAFTFFSGLLGDYDDMKSLQGSLRFTMHETMNGFDILKYPLDDLFDEHVLHFSDGDTFSFHMGFVNTKSRNLRRDVKFDLTSPIPRVTLKDEMEALERLKNSEFGKRNSAVKRAPTGVLECGHVDQMNYLTVKSFSTSDIEGFIDELSECTANFDDNNDPITIYMEMNGGGIIFLELLVFYYLFPDADPSILVAMRKTDTNKKIAIDNSYAATFSNNENGCHMYQKDKEGYNSFWDKTEKDDFGDGIVHKRTKKVWWIFKEYAKEYGKGLMKNPRKPTDIIVVTDGFCFSACSMFVDNVLRTGSGIVTGIGSTYPDDERYVAAQCPSSVIGPADYVSKLQKYVKKGLVFQATYTESYNISAENDEKIPGDFETMRIDKHLGYYQSMFADIEEIIEHTKDLHEEFQEKCNPYNERLLFVTDKCKVDDKHALAVGYACGSDGVWNKSDCRIQTCEEHYAVDFKNNKCMVNDCDPRYPFPPDPSESSSSIVRPLVELVSFVLVALYHFIH